MIDLVTLKNGVRVVLIPLNGMRSVTVEVSLQMGSKYEEKYEAGLSHFLEHMAFKGTRLRSTYKEIFNEIDSKGASFEAETGYETTSYRIITVRKNVEWAAELLSDLIYNSTFPEAEVEKEKGVIAEEIKMYQDNPMMGLGAELVDFLYGSTIKGCWTISGNVSDVKRINRQKLVQYRDKYFSQGRMVVVVCGDVEASHLDKVSSFFVKPESNIERLDEVEISLTSEPEKEIVKLGEQSHFGMAIPTFGSLDKRRYELRVLEVMLSGNASSVLFEEIRSNLGLAYYVSSMGEELVETGFWGVQVGVANENLERTIELTKKYVFDKKWINSERLSQVKNYIEGKTLLAMDRSDYWTSIVAERLLLKNETVDPIKEVAKIKKISLNDVYKLHEEFFDKKRVKVYKISGKK